VHWIHAAPELRPRAGTFKRHLSPADSRKFLQIRIPGSHGHGLIRRMNLRQLIQPDPDWLDAPTPRRVATVALTACVGLAVYGFTVGFWRDPVMGAFVAVKLPLLVALTLGCNGLLNGLLGLLLGTGLDFRQSLLALLSSFALAIGSRIVAVYFALCFLKSAVTMTAGSQRGPLVIWNAVFLLVSLQMTTSPRPILGKSDVLLTQEKKFFIQHWFETMGESLKPETSTVSQDSNRN
jgi:hypothetical protein